MKIFKWCRTAGSFILSAVLLISALGIVMGAAPPADEAAQLTPDAESGLRITNQSGRNFLRGWELPPAGNFTAAHFLDAMLPAPADHTLMIFHGSQMDNSQLAPEDIVSTGDEMRLVRNADSQVVHRASIVITGDALGIGTMNVSQVNQVGSMMGQGVTNAYQMAADLNSDGKLDADDFQAAAAILTANSGGAGDTVSRAPASMTPRVSTVPADLYTVHQGDQVTFRIESQAISTDALIDVDPAQLRYEGNTGLGTREHLLLTTAGSGEYAYAEYTYTVLAKPGSMVPFSLTHTVVQATEDDSEPLSVESDPWTFVEVIGDSLSYSPEACPTVTGPETVYVGEEIDIQVLTPADASDCLASISTSGLELLGISAEGGAADLCTDTRINWNGGSRILTYSYKVTARAGESVRFVLHDTISYLTKYGELVSGGQTSWGARADAGTAHPMITLKKPAHGSLQAAWQPEAAQPTPTPAPIVGADPAEPTSTGSAAAPTATAMPSFTTTNQDVSFRTYTKGDYVALTATPAAGYVLSTLTAVSGDQTLTYDRLDPSDGTGRFGVDTKFYVKSKTNNKVELRFTVPALDVVVTANFITQAEADEQDQAQPTPTPTPDPSAAPSPTLTPDPSETPAPSESPSASASETAAPSESPSASASETAAPSESPSASASETAAPTQQPSPSLTPRPTWTPSPTPAPTERWNFELPTDSGLRIAETSAGMPYITGRNLVVTPDGMHVSDFVSQIAAPPAGTIAVMTEDGREVAPSAVLATGQVLEARSAAGDLMDHAYIVVKGDVLGTGVSNIAQLTTVANAVLGNTTMTGLRKEAADMNLNGRLDIADLVAVAHTITR